MAKINFGTTVNDARGKLNGTVFSKNKSGAYMRRKVTPANPNTTPQVNVRDNFGSLSREWSGTLTDSERAQWISYAQTYPRLDIFGASIVISGLNMFLSLNRILNQIGLGPITTPPANNLVAPIPLDPTSLVVTAAGVVTFDQTALAGDINSSFYVFGTPSLPPGRKAQKNNFRFVKLVNQSAGPFPATLSVATEYIALFGSPIATQKVSLLIATVNTLKGLVTSGQMLSAIVT